jgi:two-component system, cell cycle sensor histidine kinase and response regulator CckA
LRVTARLLQRKGYQVLKARGGQEALDVLAHSTVDLVLTDLMMPGMSGGELIARLAAEAPDLPVVCMSGHAADESSRWQAASGSAAFLHKPFSGDELFHVAAEALGRRRVANG